jgi:GT2 family glycosyltransferase
MNSRRNLPLISVVIPNHNGAGYLEACLRSLQAQTHENIEIVVVDNASRDQSAEIVQRSASGAILLRENRNLGFAGGVNAGVRASHGEWIAVLNNDTEVAADWLTKCANAIQDHPEASYFACKILDFSDRSRIYSAGDCFLRMGVGYRRGQEQKDRPDFDMECEIFSASGCAAVYRKKVLEEIGGFDERFFAYLEDVDLGLRLQAQSNRGYYIPGAEVYHHGAATSGGEFSPLAVRLRTRNSLLLLLKNMPILFLLRCAPMILCAQLAWFLRATAHRRLGSYLRGLCSAIRLAPAMVRDRADLLRRCQNSRQALWRKILNSESQARRDFSPEPAESVSAFLRWYFRVF